MNCNYLKRLDSGFRRNDGEGGCWSFYEFIKLEPRLNIKTKRAGKFEHFSKISMAWAGICRLLTPSIFELHKEKT